ncbi:MAG: DUF5916 domain-containing protein, partial [Saprospiraceae bacterium]|nr:DUF5916 domain-containing protein [Saprospiraceae bacterium]
MSPNKVTIAFFFLCLWSWQPLFSQGGTHEQMPVLVVRKTEPIVLDGKLDENTWKMSQPARDFWQYFPSDSIRSVLDTRVYMLYDDNYLYIGAYCESVGNDYVIPSLKRDYSARGNDILTYVLDTYDDGTNAFVFGINPAGVRREALISNGGAEVRRDWNDSWDNKWSGEAHIGDGYWSAEIAIPFSTLRFDKSQKQWAFNCYRFDTQTNTRSSWTRIPRNQSLINLAFTNKMLWEERPPGAGSKLSFIPFGTGAFTQDYEEGEDADVDFDIGGDAKVAITSGLNLDLTFNPDFSQVEVDEQVINLDRFEIFFPERRQFFLENADLFGNFGDDRINPFFSRRIGVSRDTSTGQNIQNTIYYGARLSGKLDQNWRVGLLNMQTAQVERSGLPGFNYTVAAMQRKVFSRSNIGLIFVNKQALTTSDNGGDFNKYNRVIGLDYNLATPDNRWNGKAFFHRSFSPQTASKGGQFAHGARLEYRVYRFGASWSHQYVDGDYIAEVGFVPRKDIFRIRPEARLFFYPDSGPFVQHGPQLQFSMLWKPELGRTDHRIELGW